MLELRLITVTTFTIDRNLRVQLFSDMDSELNALSSKEEKESDGVTRLKTKLEILHRKRKQITKQTSRAEERVEKLQVKRKTVTQQLSAVKSHRR